MRRPEAVLFDFDGVLADTEPVHWKCWRDILAPLGIRLEWDWYAENCIGLSERAMMEALLKLSAKPGSTVDELLALYPLKKKAFREAGLREPIISDELLVAIKSLNGTPMAVVTSSGRTEIEPILQRYNLLAEMETCVYGDDVPALKPDPAPYRIAKERLGVSDALVFEDSEAGIQSATAAGCQVVRVAHAADLPRLMRENGLA